MAIFYFFYFEAYVKNNENRLISANLSVLNQMGNNVEKKINVYIRSAEDLKGKVKPLWDEQNKNDKDSLTPEKEKKLIDTLNNEGDLNKNIKLVRFITGSDHEKQLAVLQGKASVKNFYFYALASES